MLNKVPVGKIGDDVENFIKVRLICESDGKYLKYLLLMYAENEPAMKKNETWSTLHNRG